MIVLVAVACGACWLVGAVMGIALAKAADRGDRRRGGTLDFTLTGNTAATSQKIAAGEHIPIVTRIEPWTHGTPRDQSAA